MKEKSFEPLNCGKKVLKFTVMGDPVGQGRPRFTTIGGHVKAYDAKKSSDYKSYVKLLALEAAEKQGWEYCAREALKLTVVAYFNIPKSKSKTFKANAIHGKEFPTKKPDCSNLIKGIEDAMNGIIYHDDSQIVELNISKVYSMIPRVEVSIEYVA